MALNNFANLKSSIANWLGRSDLTNEITDFIALAEQDFNSKLANAGYNKMINLETLSVNNEIQALPTGFLGVVSIYIDSNKKNSLQYVTPETAFSMYGGSLVGQPEVYTIISDNIHFYPMPDSTYSVKMYYIKKFDVLANDADTNDILSNHSDIYLYGSLYFSHTFIRGIDPTIIQEWLSFYNNGVERVVALNAKNKYNQDAPLIMRSTVNEE